MCNRLDGTFYILQKQNICKFYIVRALLELFVFLLTLSMICSPILKVIKVYTVLQSVVMETNSATVERMSAGIIPWKGENSVALHVQTTMTLQTR